MVLDEFVREPFSPGGTAPEQIIRPLFQGARSVRLSEGEGERGGNGRQSGRIEGRARAAAQGRAGSRWFV